MEAIEKETRRDLRDFLKIAFTSMVHLCSRMIAISNPLPTVTTPHSPLRAGHSKAIGMPRVLWNRTCGRNLKARF